MSMSEHEIRQLDQQYGRVEDRRQERLNACCDALKICIQQKAEMLEALKNLVAQCSDISGINVLQAELAIENAEGGQ